MHAPLLVASYYTLAGKVYPGGPDDSPFTFRRRCEAASAAGYRGIGVSGYDLAASLARHGAREMRQILDDTGMEEFEVECLQDWFADGDARKASDAMRQAWLDAAADLRISHMKVVGDVMGTGVSFERMADEFATICEQTAPLDIRVSIEIFPAANINDITTGRQLMDLVGARNTPGSGLLIDIWHMSRGGVPFSEIAALPPCYIAHIELDDAAAEQIGTVYEDTQLRRLLPGEGAFDVQGFLRAVRDSGYDGPYGIEILSETFRGMEPEEAAKRSYDATMRQFRILAENT